MALTELTDHQMDMLGDAMNDARTAMLNLARLMESFGQGVVTIPLGARYVAVFVEREQARALSTHGRTA